MEYAVCAASSDSEDATTEIDEEERVLSNTGRQGSLFEVAAESSTNNAHGSIGMSFINKPPSARNGWGTMDSMKAESGEKAPHKDIQDLIHFGKKDGKKVPVPSGVHSTLAVNISEEDGVSYSDSEDLPLQTVSEDEEQELVTEKDLGETAEEFELHNSTADFGVICKQNARRSEVQRKKRHFTEDGKDQGSKLAKMSEQLQKNRMPCASTECGESASDPTSIQASHLEENYAAEEPVNCTQSTELFHLLHKVHTREAKYNCPECNRTCNNSSHLTQHRILYHHIRKPYHRIENPFMCPECNNPFLTADCMSEHRLQHHNVEKPYQCSDCNTAFNSLHLQNNHWKTHHALECLKCPECKKCFLNPEGLLMHKVAVHNAEKPFQCTECDFKCFSAPGLNKHLRKHLKL